MYEGIKKALEVATIIVIVVITTVYGLSLLLNQ